MVFHSNHASWRDWARMLRLHQWLKNLLIFVPLLAAHRITEVALIRDGVLAFLIFGLCASSVYVLNDLIDLDDDRCHPVKCQRPLADGRVSIQSAIVVFPLLLVLAFAAALLWLPIAFALVLSGYYILTLVYSLVLKRYIVIDVVALALLYTLRVIAGGAVFAIDITFWILAFSMFIFLSLALVKRHTELYQARVKEQTGKTPGRGYYPGDLEIIASLGGSAGYMAVLVLALYINDLNTANLYKFPEFIWLACPLLLFWVTRVWMLAHRGEMRDDPVVFAIHDPVSLMVGVLFGLVFWAAT